MRRPTVTTQKSLKSNKLFVKQGLGNFMWVASSDPLLRVPVPAGTRTTREHAVGDKTIYLVSDDQELSEPMFHIPGVQLWIVCRMNPETDSIQPVFVSGKTRVPLCTPTEPELHDTWDAIRYIKESMANALTTKSQLDAYQEKQERKRDNELFESARELVEEHENYGGDPQTRSRPVSFPEARRPQLITGRTA